MPSQDQALCGSALCASGFSSSTAEVVEGSSPNLVSTLKKYIKTKLRYLLSTIYIKRSNKLLATEFPQIWKKTPIFFKRRMCKTHLLSDLWGNVSLPRRPIFIFHPLGAQSTALSVASPLGLKKHKWMAGKINTSHVILAVIVGRCTLPETNSKSPSKIGKS